MTVNLETFKGNGFLAEIIRTNRRKTVSVKVQAGKVSVVVPQSLPDGRIEELVIKKTRWIREKLKLHRESLPVKPKDYVSGEGFTYLGRNYRLKVEKGKPKSVILKNARLVVTLPDGPKSPERVKNALVQWYRTHAEEKLGEKVDRYAKIMRVTPASLGIKTFRSRWGSCSHAGHVLFNWKIIIAPHRIVDYVVVHELCHLIEHNHSPEFWKCVERVFPDYRECKDWLKDNGRGLTI